MSILKNADNSDDLKDIINHYLESDRQGRITFLISEIKNNKYKRIAYVFCLLFILMKLKGENDEIVFHLCSHALILGLNEYAFTYIKHIESREFFSELLIENPLPNNINDIKDYKTMLDYLTKKTNDCNALFKVGIIMLEFGEEHGYTMIEDALNLSQGKIRSYFVLKYVNYLFDKGLESKAHAILNRYLDSEEKNPALIYKAAVLCEDTDKQRAIRLFKMIIDMGMQYLDTEERISNLTKEAKHSKIINNENNSNGNDNIQFS